MGTMKSDEAFDGNGKRIGKILSERLNFNNSNDFIGISGVNSVLEVSGKTYRISPYGYVFDETGNVNGRNFSFGDIYSPEGTALSYTSGNGKTENGSLNEIARLTGSGIFLDKNDKPLGKIIEINI